MWTPNPGLPGSVPTRRLNVRFPTAHLLAGILLLGAFPSPASAYFTTDRFLVRQCDDAAQYLVHAGAFSSTATFGVCDDCGTATLVSSEIGAGGSGVTNEYVCDEDSGNYPAEFRREIDQWPELTEAEEASGEWETECTWAAPVSGVGGYVYRFRDCEEGYIRQLWSCGIDPDENVPIGLDLLHPMLEPGSRCVLESNGLPDASDGSNDVSVSCASAPGLSLGFGGLIALLALRRRRRA